MVPSGLAGKRGTAGITQGNGTHQIVRPEAISISTTGKGKLKGKVKQQLFFGSYYEVHVQLKEVNLKVRDANGGFEPGDQVYLSFDPG